MWDETVLHTVEAVGSATLPWSPENDALGLLLRKREIPLPRPEGRGIHEGDLSTASPATTYWEPLWSQGRRYRQLDDAENRLLQDRLGPGRERLALGCGDGSLARRLAAFGYRATGIDCSPSAIALAAAQDAGPGREPVWRCMDIATGDLGALPEPA